MHIDERIDLFLNDLRDQGFDIKTEPTENRSKIWGPKAFRTTIKRGKYSRHFDTCAGEGWMSRSNVEAFRTLQDILRDIVGNISYDTWSSDDKEYYIRQFGKRSARTYFTELKKAENALHEILGDVHFEYFCNLDQPLEEDAF